MFTSKIPWNHFHLHSVSLIDSVDTELLHGVHLVSYQTLITCHQQVTVYHGVDTKVKADRYVTSMPVLMSFWNPFSVTKVIQKLSMLISILVTRLLFVVVFSPWHMWWVMVLAPIRCVAIFWVILKFIDWAEFVMFLLLTLIIHITIVSEYQCITYNERAIKLWSFLVWKNSRLTMQFLQKIQLKNYNKVWNPNYHVYHITCTTLHSIRSGLEAIPMASLPQHQQI